MSTPYTLHMGDCLAVLPMLAVGSIDAVVTDPPYHLTSGKASGEIGHPSWTGQTALDRTARKRGFMGHTWDGGDIAFRPETWRAVLRVLKPGAHLAAFGGTRTYHRLACAIEDAGFEIRDSLHWFTGQGFPKSTNPALHLLSLPRSTDRAGWRRWYRFVRGSMQGTALKPAHEPIILARKPMEGGIARNILAHGTGGLCLDAARVGANGGGTHCANRDAEGRCLGHRNAGQSTSGETFHGPDETGGRFPPNVLLTHGAGCRRMGTKRIRGSNFQGHPLGHVNEVFGADNRPRPPAGYASPDGHEDVDAWECEEGCPVAELDRQSGVSGSGDGPGVIHARESIGYGGSSVPFETTKYGDVGGASRFFPVSAWGPEDVSPFYYEPKATRAEKEQGCEVLPSKRREEVTGRKAESAGQNNPRAGVRRRGEIRNSHSTVKPVDLIRWLVRLIVPPGAVCLDLFMGSGSTGVACQREDRPFIGIELSPEYHAIAEARIGAAGDAAAGVDRHIIERKTADGATERVIAKQRTLF